MREEVGDDLRLARVLGEPGGLPGVVGAGEEVEQRAVVHRLERGVGVVVRPDDGMPGPLQLGPDRVGARSGSSTAGVRTPSQISALGT